MMPPDRTEQVSADSVAPIKQEVGRSVNTHQESDKVTQQEYTAVLEAIRPVWVSCETVEQIRTALEAPPQSPGVSEGLKALESLHAECVMRGAEAGDRRYRAGGNNEQITEDARREIYAEFGDRVQGIRAALLEEAQPSPDPIPQSYWRPVPCGHPPDPVAMYNRYGRPACHCGELLDPADALPVDVPEAPGPIAHCQHCGCHIAIPPKARPSETRYTVEEIRERMLSIQAVFRGAFAQYDWLNPTAPNTQESAEEQQASVEPFGAGMEAAFDAAFSEAQPSEGEGEALIQKFEARAKELHEMQREWEAKPGGSEPGRLNYTYATRCAAIYEFIRDELLTVLEAAQPDPQPSVEEGVVKGLSRRERDRLDDAALRLERLAGTLPPHSVTASDCRHEADVIRQVLAATKGEHSHGC